MVTQYDTQIGPEPPPTNQGYGGLSTFGGLMTVAGAVGSAIGAFYSAKSSQYQLKSQAMTLEFQASMANLTARAAERDAEFLLVSGQQQINLSQLRYRQALAASRARTAAGGLQAGVGSAAEVDASIQFAEKADTIALNMSRIRAANAARRGATNQRIQGLLAGVSAANLRSGAGAISPWMGAGSSLLGSAGAVAGRLTAFEQQRLLSSRLNGG